MNLYESLIRGWERGDSRLLLTSRSEFTFRVYRSCWSNLSYKLCSTSAWLAAISYDLNSFEAWPCSTACLKFLRIRSESFTACFSSCISYLCSLFCWLKSRSKCSSFLARSMSLSPLFEVLERICSTWVSRRSMSRTLVYICMLWAYIMCLICSNSFLVSALSWVSFWSC